MKVKSENFIIKSIFGLFAITLIATFWAFFWRINIEFHVFLLVINGFIFVKFKNLIVDDYLIFWSEINTISKNIKIIILFTSILLIAQCATAPYLADNESYFIQTIKWINEYGLVKGLVNLHIFFGQTSGWHICQSVFNFSFIYNKFNDLSGFCLLIGNVFAFQKLDLYYKNYNKNNLIIGLFPIFNLLFFRFISAPSPDIPVYVFSFIVFYYFLMNFINLNNENFKLITILVLFILFIKTTTIAILFIPIVLFCYNYKKLRSIILPIAYLSFIVFLLYVIKNVIITAYPLYPLKYFGFINLDYALPNKMLEFLATATKADAFWLSSVQYQQMTIFQLIKIWFTATIIDGFFNGLTFIVLLFSPFFIYKYKNEKVVWYLYFIVVAQMIIMFLTSPQYRYFIHFILIFVLIIVSTILFNKKLILSFIVLSNLAISIVLFFPLNFKKVAKNEFISENNTFSFKNFIFPDDNTKTKTGYIVIKKGNLKYNSPIENTFFWGSCNGKLPAVNQLQINYFEKYYQIFPQQRSKNLKDGFYAKKKIVK
jgi:hypothetical protein